MKEFEMPVFDFILFGEENILSASCPQFNCTNPLGYGDLCTGPSGHDYCQPGAGYNPPCPNDDL